MPTFNPKDVDEVLDEVSLIAKDNEVNIPEAPAVSNVKVWIKGYGVTLTVRGEKVNDMIQKTVSIIDYAESHGWKNTWDTEAPKANVGACPKCSNPLIEAKTKDGKTFKKCSTNKWNKVTKQASGCDYIEWPE